MYKKLNHESLPSDHTKELMKISNVAFGAGGYQDAQFGLFLDFSSKSSGVSASIVGGWDYSIKVDKYTKWTEEDRSHDMAQMCKTISQILSDAKVSSVDKLKGIPVEVVFSQRTIQSFRILEEVL